MKRFAVAAAAAAALLVPVAQATNAPPPNEHGLITHQTTCYGAPLFSPGLPGDLVYMTPLAAGSTFWINVGGEDMHFRVQSATITYDADPEHPLSYSYGKETGLTDTTITCYGSFPDYSVVSHDVLIR